MTADPTSPIDPHLLEQIIAVIKQISPVPNLEWNHDTPLAEDGFWITGMFDYVELVMELETATGIRVSDDDMDRINIVSMTVGELYQVMASIRDSQAPHHTPTTGEATVTSNTPSDQVLYDQIVAAIREVASQPSMACTPDTLLGEGEGGFGIKDSLDYIELTHIEAETGISVSDELLGDVDGDTITVIQLYNIVQSERYK